jgi:hypothetical protein
MKFTLHRARTEKPCGSYRCPNTIEPGDLYVRHVAFPGEEGHEEGTQPWVLLECAPCVDKHGDWIRERYGVPARLGARVVFDGRPGVIIALHSGSIHVRLDSGETVPVHPMWRMEYMDQMVDAR